MSLPLTSNYVEVDLDISENFCYNIFMKSKKQLQKIASQIIELESACKKSDNISKNMSEMENIMSNLSFEDMLPLLALLEERQNEIEITHCP